MYVVKLWPGGRIESRESVIPWDKIPEKLIGTFLTQFFSQIIYKQICSKINNIFYLPMIGLLFKSRPEKEAPRINGDNGIKSTKTSFKAFISDVKDFHWMNEYWVMNTICIIVWVGVFEESKQMVISVDISLAAQWSVEQTKFSLLGLKKDRVGYSMEI